MAVLAAVQGTRPGFTLGGTLEVVATGVIIGVPAGLTLLVGRLRVWRSCRFLGAIGGGLLFSGLALVPPPAARSASTGVSSAVLIVALVLFGTLFVSWGVTLVAAVDQMFGMGRSGESIQDGL